MEKNNIKRARFIRVAEIRVNEIIKKIHALSSLHKNTMYDSTAEDLQKIISALRHELDWLEAEYAGQHRFRLDAAESQEAAPDAVCGELLLQQTGEEAKNNG